MYEVKALGRVVADYLPFPENHPYHGEFLRNHFLIEGVEVNIEGQPQIVKLRYHQVNNETHNLLLKFPVTFEMAQQMQKQVVSSRTSTKKRPQWWGSLTFHIEEGENWRMPHSTKVKSQGTVTRISHMLMSADAPVACEYLPGKIQKMTETEFIMKLEHAIQWAELAFDPTAVSNHDAAEAAARDEAERLAQEEAEAETLSQTGVEATEEPQPKTTKTKTTKAEVEGDIQEALVQGFRPESVEVEVEDANC